MTNLTKRLVQIGPLFLHVIELLLEPRRHLDSGSTVSLTGRGVLNDA